MTEPTFSYLKKVKETEPRAGLVWGKVYSRTKIHSPRFPVETEKFDTGQNKVALHSHTVSTARSLVQNRKYDQHDKNCV